MLSEVVEEVRAANLEAGVQVPGLVVVDSLNTTISTIEYDADFTDKPRPGNHAAAVGRAIAKLNNRIGATPVAVLLISQKRLAFGMGRSYSVEQSGGKATGHIASLSISLFSSGKLKHGTTMYGQEVKATIRKSQISMPFREASFRVLWGEGVDYNHSLLLLASSYGIVSIGSSGWYELPDFEGETLKWRGDAGFSKVIEKHPDLVAIIEQRIKERRAAGKAPRSSKVVIDEPEVEAEEEVDES
jgi:recombination protein RecA